MNKNEIEDIKEVDKKNKIIRIYFKNNTASDYKML